MAQRTSDKNEKKGPREVVPEFYSTDNGVGYPVIDPSPQFIWAHHRRRWTIIDGRVVPELSKIPLTSGCNRVSRTSDGRIRFADTQAFFQDRHWQIIPHKLAPNGRSYLQAVDTLVRDGDVREATISVFETAHAGEAQTEWDFPAYADWLESLVRKGHISPIEPQRAAKMLEAAKSLLAKAELRLSKGQASSTERVDALRAEVAIWARLAQVRGARVAPREVDVGFDDEADAPPAPAPKPRSSSKPAPKEGE